MVLLVLKHTGSWKKTQRVFQEDSLCLKNPCVSEEAAKTVCFRSGCLKNPAQESPENPRKRRSGSETHYVSEAARVCFCRRRTRRNILGVLRVRRVLLKHTVSSRPFCCSSCFSRRRTPKEEPQKKNPKNPKNRSSFLKQKKQKNTVFTWNAPFFKNGSFKKRCCSLKNRSGVRFWNTEEPQEPLGFLGRKTLLLLLVLVFLWVLLVLLWRRKTLLSAVS